MQKVKEDAVIITADQVIEVDGQVREKPETVEKCKVVATLVDDARSITIWPFFDLQEYLRSYSAGKPATCIVGVTVYNTVTKQRLSGCAVAKQYFKPSLFDASVVIVVVVIVR